MIVRAVSRSRLHQDAAPLGAASGWRGGGAGSARCSRWAARGPRRPAPGRPRRRRRRSPGAIGAYDGSPAFCSSTTAAIRRSVSSTCSARDHAVVQPVGDVLRGDPAGRAVLHQRLAGDVGDLGAARPRRRPSARRTRAGSGGCCRSRPAGPRRDHEAGSPSGTVQQLARGRARRPPAAAPPAGPGRRPGGSAARAWWPRSATAPRRSWRRPAGGRSWPRSIAARLSGAAHMPLPIWARPSSPHSRPMSTLRSS